MVVVSLLGRLLVYCSQRISTTSSSHRRREKKRTLLHEHEPGLHEQLLHEHEAFPQPPMMKMKSFVGGEV